MGNQRRVNPWSRSGGEEIYGVKKEMENRRETVDCLVMVEREHEGERRRVVVMAEGVCCGVLVV